MRLLLRYCTHGALASRLGVDRSTVTYWAHPKTPKAPGPEARELLADPKVLAGLPFAIPLSAWRQRPDPNPHAPPVARAA